MVQRRVRRTSEGSAADAGSDGSGSRTTFRQQFYKTTLCRFYQRGCTKGARCCFAHGVKELQQAPDLTKTSLCPRWKSFCCELSSEECPFAHGWAELRVTPAFAEQNRRRQGEPGPPPPSPHDLAPGDSATTPRGLANEGGTAALALENARHALAMPTSAAWHFGGQTTSPGSEHSAEGSSQSAGDDPREYPSTGRSARGPRGLASGGGAAALVPQNAGQARAMPMPVAWNVGGQPTSSGSEHSADGSSQSAGDDPREYQVVGHNAEASPLQGQTYNAWVQQLVGSMGYRCAHGGFIDVCQPMQPCVVMRPVIVDWTLSPQTAEAMRTMLSQWMPSHYED